MGAALRTLLKKLHPPKIFACGKKYSWQNWILLISTEKNLIELTVKELAG